MSDFNKRARQTFASLQLPFAFCLLLLAFLNVNAQAPMRVESKQEEKPKLSTVRGKVVYDDTGRPVRRSTVILARQDGNNPGSTSLTDNNGNFEVKNVPEGVYFIMVNAPGIVSPFSYIEDLAKLDKGPNNQIFESAKEEFGRVVVDGKEEVKVEVRAKRGGAINGKIQYSDGDPAINVRVSIFRKKKDGKLVQTLSNLSETFFGTKTDDRGVYRIAGLPPGEYIISASENSSHSDDERSGRDGMFETMFGGMTSYITTFYPDATSPESATVINVSMGEEQNDINITLPERGLYKLAGTAIARRDKKSLKVAAVKIQKKDKTTSILSQIPEFRTNKTTTDEEGNWSFKELPDGVYTITIEPPYEYEKPVTPDDVDGEVRRNAPPKRRLSSKKQEVTISGGDVTNLVVELSEGATISGTVVLANGQPFSNNLYVRAEPLLSSSAAEDETIEDLSNRTGYVHEGKFSIEALPAGPVQLSAEFYNNDKYYVKSIKVSGADLMNSPLNIAEGADVKNIQVIIGDDAATLKGVVKSADGKPAIGTSLVLISTDPSRWRARNSYKSFNFSITDTKGEFTTTTAPGEYFIVFLRPGENVMNINPEWIRERSANAQRVSLRSNDKQTVTLTLQ